MASTSETGHEVNRSNFNSLLAICNSFGAIYNPSLSMLTLAGMNTLNNTADGLQTAVTNQWGLIKDPINARQILFSPLGKLVTRIMRGLSNTDASDEIKADCKTIADDIRGFNKAEPAPKEKPATDTPQEEDFVSRSHMSFVQRTANFLKLIALLQTIPTYKPNEVDLQLVSLKKYYDNLKKADDELTSLLTPYYTALRNRDKTFYTPKTGLVDVAFACKDYIISMTDKGNKSPEYKRVSKIKFTRPAK